LHRDRRAHRELYELALALGLPAAGLFALTRFAPFRWLQVVGLVGLSATGALFVWRAERLVATYEADLSVGTAGDSSSGVLRAEVGTIVGLDRPVGSPRSRSPHYRRRPVLESMVTDSSGEAPSPG
jgi:hypothetical protein